MPMLVKAVRVTTRERALWRHCAICDELAALPPEVTVCPSCEPQGVDAGRRGR